MATHQGVSGEKTVDNDDVTGKSDLLKDIHSAISQPVGRGSLR